MRVCGGWSVCVYVCAKTGVYLIVVVEEVLAYVLACVLLFLYFGFPVPEHRTGKIESIVWVREYMIKQLRIERPPPIVICFLGWGYYKPPSMFICFP